jgi:four helix bundle protein
MFAHQKLKVYDKALSFAAAVNSLTGAWPKIHAVLDHLNRASDSIVLNIAEGSRLRSAPAKQRATDYAIGSVLECVACLDIAWIKELLSAEARVRERQNLWEITKMLFGLRKSWENWVLKEDLSLPGPANSGSQAELLFHHERLDVYQTALTFVRWFHAVPGGKDLRGRTYREVDKSSTSLVLNIAEGNGRHFEDDQCKFLEISHAASVRTAAYLDLCERKDGLPATEILQGKALLERVQMMLYRMISD